MKEASQRTDCCLRLIRLKDPSEARQKAESLAARGLTLFDLPPQRVWITVGNRTTLPVSNVNLVVGVVDQSGRTVYGPERIGTGGDVIPGTVMPIGSNSDERDPKTWRTVATNFPAIMGTYPPNVMPEEILSDHPERLRAVLCTQSNPLRSYADTRAYEEAFGKLDLLVTMDEGRRRIPDGGLFVRDEEIANWKLEFDFGDDAKAGEGDGEPVDFSTQTSLGACPKCQGRVFEHGSSYVCEHAVGAHATCDFKSGKIILQQPVEREQMTRLLATGKTALLENFVSNKTRRKFKAYLAFDAKEGKVTFQFEPRPARPAAKAPAKKAAAKKTAA